MGNHNQNETVWHGLSSVTHVTVEFSVFRMFMFAFWCQLLLLEQELESELAAQMLFASKG